MRKATIKARVLERFLAFARERGADPRELLRRSGVDADVLGPDLDHRVPLSLYAGVMRVAKELCDDPALALHFGESVDLAEISLAGMTGGSMGNMHDALAQLNRDSTLDVDFGGAADRFRFVEADGDLLFVDERPDPNAFAEFTEAFFARAVTAMRRWMPAVPLIKGVEVTHPEPPYRDEYDRIFQVPVRFGQERNALRIAGAIWELSRSRFPRTYAAEVIRRHADAEFEKLEKGRTVRGQLELLLQALLPAGDFSVTSVARRLGMSRQTLFRKLKAEGTSFARVLDELRKELARRYVEDERLPVNEVAYRLGFSDPAAFSRAFKRWTGSSPRDARERGNRAHSRPD